MRNTTLLFLATALTVVSGACSHAAAGDPGGAPSAVAAAVAAPPHAAQPVYRVPVEGLPAMGNPNALVTIVELTDYQCPYCQRAEETMAKLRATYGDDLRVVVVEAPLPMHEHAQPAAVAALAADAQGKFEAMHARLFAQKGALDDDALESAARAAGLSLDRLAADRTAAAEALARAQHLVSTLGARGTPTFFVSGRRVVGAQPFEVFRDVIDERLAAARALVKAGTRPRDVYAELVKDGATTVTEDAHDDGPGCGGGDCKGKGSGAPDVGETVEAVPTEGAPVRGSPHAQTTIVAFSDFECPFCARAEATLRAVEAAHPNDVRVVFKNLPLPFHKHARLAAKASLAADAQGRFWEMHDRLFAHPGQPLEREALERLASDLGLDVARFSRDLDDPALEARLARDQADADALKVNGTPTFFVNGRRIVGAQPAAVFEGVIAKGAAK